MRRTARSAWIAVAIAGGVMAAWTAEALEERFEDLPASVEVAGVFGVDVAQAFLTFQNVAPMQTTVLGEGRFFNEVTCRSNAGRPWYLKAHLVALKHTGTGRTLPAETLKWKIVGSTGAGSSAGRVDFQPFSEQPETLYASGGDDVRGRDVVLQFQYSLTPPPSSLAGTYAGQLVFTMAEAP
jgi:hypothetical protein